VKVTYASPLLFVSRSPVLFVAVAGQVGKRPIPGNSHLAPLGSFPSGKLRR